MFSLNRTNPLFPKPLPKPKPGTVKVVRAIYRHTARFADELSFDEGDLLYIFDFNGDEWWKARCNNQTGFIPCNYVAYLTEELIEPLHDAARRGNLAFLQECLTQGVSATSLDAMGNTPLSWAALANHTDCVRSLLSHSVATLNVQNIYGDTPLHRAASKNHYGVVELLLLYGANPNIKNRTGDIPAKLASDPAVKNLLQQYMRGTNSGAHSSFKPEEYGNDDSD